MALTTNDLKLIKEVMKITIDEELEIKLEEKFNEKLGTILSKDEFYSKMDEVMGELKAMREEHTMLSGRVYDDHEPRIKKIEKKLDIQVAI